MRICHSNVCVLIVDGGVREIYHGTSGVDSYILILDHRHLARAIECIAKSTPTTELVSMLLHFNLWGMAGDPQFRYKISTQGPVILTWLEAQVSHEFLF